MSLTLQLLASTATIASSWAYGNKWLSGPSIGLVAQVPWYAMMIHDGLWGLLPVNAVMTILHARNLLKWWREAKQNQ